MNLLDRLLEHDRWTTCLLIERSRGLDDTQLDRIFTFGGRSLRQTFAHVVRNVEAWTDLMRGVPLRAGAGARPSLVDLRARLESAATELAELAREVEGRNGWDETWLDTLDEPPRAKSFGGAIAHVITHSMHHRAQLIAMLRELGVDELPEGDVLSWERQTRGASND